MMKVLSIVLSKRCTHTENADTGLVVDVGANLGIVSLFAAKHGCRVYAFEPQPELASSIRLAQKLNEDFATNSETNAVKSAGSDLFMPKIVVSENIVGDGTAVVGSISHAGDNWGAATETTINAMGDVEVFARGSHVQNFEIRSEQASSMNNNIRTARLDLRRGDNVFRKARNVCKSDSDHGHMNTHDTHEAILCATGIALHLLRLLSSCSGCHHVPAVSLDETVALNGKNIVLLKIDVEGSEMRVLKGAKAMIERGRVENIFIEWNPASYEKGDIVDMMHWLHSLGYRALESRWGKTCEKDTDKIDWNPDNLNVYEGIVTAKPTELLDKKWLSEPGELYIFSPRSPLATFYTQYR